MDLKDILFIRFLKMFFYIDFIMLFNLRLKDYYDKELENF